MERMYSVLEATTRLFKKEMDTDARGAEINLALYTDVSASRRLIVDAKLRPEGSAMDRHTSYRNLTLSQSSQSAAGNRNVALGIGGRRRSLERPTLQSESLSAFSSRFVDQLSMGTSQADAWRWGPPGMACPPDTIDT